MPLSCQFLLCLCVVRSRAAEPPRRLQNRVCSSIALPGSVCLQSTTIVRELSSSQRCGVAELAPRARVWCKSQFIALDQVTIALKTIAARVNDSRASQTASNWSYGFIGLQGTGYEEAVTSLQQLCLTGPELRHTFSMTTKSQFGSPNFHCLSLVLVVELDSIDLVSAPPPPSRPPRRSQKAPAATCRRRCPSSTQLD